MLLRMVKVTQLLYWLWYVKGILPFTSSMACETGERGRGRREERTCVEVVGGILLLQRGNFIHSIHSMSVKVKTEWNFRLERKGRREGEKVKYRSSFILPLLPHPLTRMSLSYCRGKRVTVRTERQSTGETSHSSPFSFYSPSSSSSSSSSSSACSSSFVCWFPPPTHLTLLSMQVHFVPVVARQTTFL